MTRAELRARAVEATRLCPSCDGGLPAACTCTVNVRQVVSDLLAALDTQQDAVLAALIQCARALAFTYGGSPRPSDTEHEAQACWDAMVAAYAALGVTDTRDLIQNS